MCGLIKALFGIHILFLLSACAAPGNAVRSDFSEVASEAEKFMERNGFTAGGHAEDLPVNEIESMDKYFLSSETGKSKLLSNRKGRIRGPAHCVSYKEGEYFVSFSRPADDCQVVAKVSEKKEMKLMHGCVALDFLKPCHRLNSMGSHR